MLQIWSQLCLHDELVCRRYTPSPSLNTVLVPLIPESYRPTLLYQHHNAVTAAHLGFEKTTARVHQVGYWVGMLQDIEKYCRECGLSAFQACIANLSSLDHCSHRQALGDGCCRHLRGSNLLTQQSIHFGDTGLHD